MAAGAEVQVLSGAVIMVRVSGQPSLSGPPACCWHSVWIGFALR
jgi:hypothetical protein